MTALGDYTQVAGAILANKNNQREQDRIAAENLQTGRLSAESAMQKQRIASDSDLQGKRIDATTALAGLQHTNELARLAEADKFKANEQHRAAGAAALAAGAPGYQVRQLMNPNAGFPVDYSGVQVPLKNTQQDQFQFLTRDNQEGQPQTVMVGNRQTGQLVEAPAVTALAGGAQPQQQPAAAPMAGKQPAAADAYSKIYQSNPQRLQEDVASAAAQIGTVYKTDEEQLAYLNATRKTNPTLFQALKQQLGQQQAVAR